MTFYTYAHTRVSDGKIFYIGKGKDRRAWSFNKRSVQWRKVKNKHGVDVSIIARWPTEQEAFDHEVLLIAAFRGLGYELCNHTDGGDGASGWRHSPETIAKIAASNTGLKRDKEQYERGTAAREAGRAKWVAEHWTPERRAEASKRLSGAGHPNYGKKLSDELRKKLSESHKGQRNESQMKPVICVATGQRFESGAAAARWLRENGKPRATGSLISSAARGGHRIAFGHEWVLA